jgi:hypothetical protein
VVIVLPKNKQIILINDCGAKYEEQELIKAIEWYSNGLTMNKKHIYMHGSYPAISVGKEKIHIHRLLFMYWTKKQIPKKFTIHHIDGDKLNSIKSNLTILFCSDHLSKHHKGKIFSLEHRRKLSLQNNKRKGIRHNYKRSDITPKMVFLDKNAGMSFNKISEKYSLDWECVKQRYGDFIRDNPELEVGK